jgi:transposase
LTDLKLIDYTDHLEVDMERTVRRHYTGDYKAQAVSLAESAGLAAAGRKLGISSKTIANWVRTAGEGGALSSAKRRPVSDLEAEVSRLRAENATLRTERDILKKATAFFAKESR